MVGYGNMRFLQKETLQRLTLMSDLLRDRAGRHVVYGDSSPFAGHVQVITCKTEDHKSTCLSKTVSLCPCFNISDCDKSLRKINKVLEIFTDRICPKRMTYLCFL